MPNNHEPEFRDRLYDYESPVDPEAIWQAVSAKMPPPKRRRRWWWLFSLLLLIILSAGYAWFGLDRTPAPETGTVTGNQPSLNASKDNIASSEATSATTTALGARPQDADPVDDQAVTNTSMAAQAPAAEPTIAASIRASALTEAGRLNAVSPPQNTTPDNSANTPAADTPAASGNDQVQSPATPLKSERRPSGGSSTAAIDSPKPAGTALPSAAASPGSAPAGTGVAAAAAVARSQRLFVTDQLNWPATALMDEGKVLPDRPLTPSATVFRASRTASWSVGLETTISRIGQSFNQTSSPLSSEVLVPFYEANLRPLEAISTDLLLGYTTRNDWTLRSGLGYTRLNTVAEAVSVSVNDSLRGEGVVRVDVRGPGDTTFVMGTVAITETSTRTQQYYNHLTLIDIPLLLGRRFAFGKLDLNLEAGPVLNLYARASARLPLSADTFSERADSDNRYRSSIGLSWRGQATAGYRITEQLSCYVGVDYRRLPRRGVETDQSPVRTSYSLLGGKLGLRYRF